MFRVVFMGTPGFAVPSLQALLEAGYPVVGVITQPDRPKGRGGKVQESPIKKYAAARGLDVYQPASLRAEGLDLLQALAPDICVTVAFGQILSQEVLDVPRLGTVNVHASMLPHHRGAAPVQWALLMGDAETGVTTMLTNKGVDTGDVLMRAACPIKDEDTAGTLLDRLSWMGADLLLQTLRRMEMGEYTREKQDESNASYEPMLSREKGLLDFNEGTEACLRRVRAMNPWPCAYARLSGGDLKVWKAKAAVLDNQLAEGIAGTVLYADEKHGLVIATADNAIELLEIQAPNSKRMDARAFLRGHPMNSGKLLSEVRT